MVPADVAIIGEGPGKNEDLLGKPFVGMSGHLLKDMIEESNISDKSIFITNTVLCHPSDEMAGENREPAKEEILSCRFNVMRLLNAANPRAIIYLGDIAERSFRSVISISGGSGTFKAYHPAYVLRNGGRSHPTFLHNVMMFNRVGRFLQDNPDAKMELKIKEGEYENAKG